MSFNMDFNKLLSQLDSVNTKKTYDDNSDEFWKLTKDKDGNGSAVIRFLPNKNIEDFPFVRLWTHSFKQKHGDKYRWYIENSLSTIEAVDYIAEVNRELWNTQLEENKKIATAQKRKLNYISNILVIKDPGNPENNGKVFKFKYGQKIFDKIVAAAKPEADEALDEEVPTPINAFSPKEGADFVLKQAIKDGWPNFDNSKFGKAKELFGGDDSEIKAVLDKCFELTDELAPSKFKSYDDLKKKYLWVMGQEAPKGSDKPKPSKGAEEDELNELAKLAQEEPKKVKPKVETKKELPKQETPEDDDDAAYFASLIED